MTITPISAAAGGQAQRVIALAATETRLLLRNKTVAISSLFLPVGFGVFFLYSIGPATLSDPFLWGGLAALQLAIVLTMGVYLTATQTIVARRHSRVLKRMRTSGLSDTGLLTATLLPTAAIAAGQLLIFVVIDAVAGAPLPVDASAVVLALIGGMAVAVTAAFATSTVTATPERAQITTLPLFLVMLAAATVLPFLPLDSWWQALVLLPGAPVGQLMQFAISGGSWDAGLGGLPALLPALVSLVGWPVLFGWIARRKFQWDPRN